MKTILHQKLETTVTREGTKKSRKSATPLCLCLALLALTACNTVRVTGTLKVPAEVNMAGRDRVVLQPIQGQGGQLITARLKEALAAAQFKVLDRQSLDTRFREDELKDIGVANAEERQKVMTAGVLIRGNVLRQGFTHEVQQAQQTGVQNGVKYRRIVYRDVGYGTVEVAFDVVDLGTTEIIVPKSIAVTQTGASDYYPSPPSVAREPIFNACYSQVVRRFMEAISPHDERFDVVLYKVPKVPGNDGAVGEFQGGDYAQATKDFEAALASAKGLPKITPDKVSQILSNLGLAYEFGSNYQKAIDCYRQALGLRPDSSYQRSLARCRKRIENQKSLKEQGVNAS